MDFSRNAGRLEVVCGSMFSGKSEELIRRIRRAEFAKRKTQLFKHSYDNRVTLCHVHAHSGDMLAAYAVNSPQELASFVLDDTEVIGIDEVQFFDPEIVLLIDHLVASGKRVVAAGLDLDFRGVPFGCMPILLAIADEVLKLKAVCMKSGKDAHFTQRVINGQPAKHSDPIILIGAQECYEARSRETFEIDYTPLAEYIGTHFSSKNDTQQNSL
ncbi:MAG: Thymidine kinase [candidate division TM6 bacterium GW2011_GWE2_42_60]|nr:MAG: Thymidine kinase [candidate division TM6 bacterium GW2011_GWE2_42_60]HBY05411.1 thymidine kinase [Candidatus Dependentiae bacterium]